MSVWQFLLLVALASLCRLSAAAVSILKWLLQLKRNNAKQFQNKSTTMFQSLLHVKQNT